MIRSLRIVALALLTLTVIPPLAAAQKRPDLSGTWVEDEGQRKSPYDKPAGNSGVRVTPGPPPPFVITQTPDRLTIERTRGGQVTRYVYDLDGRENKNSNGAQIQTTRTRWDGDRLVTEGSIYQVTTQGETNWKVKEVRWLTSKGELATEVTQVDEDDKSGTVFRVYRKR